jgi:hypothetical protein
MKQLQLRPWFEMTNYKLPKLKPTFIRNKLKDQPRNKWILKWEGQLRWTWVQSGWAGDYVHNFHSEYQGMPLTEGAPN